MSARLELLYEAYPAKKTISTTFVHNKYDPLVLVFFCDLGSEIPGAVRKTVG